MNAPESSDDQSADARSRGANEIADLLKSGNKVALTTHVNADGDGAGSEVALWHLLNERGMRTVIANPTPFPESYGFLLESAPGANRTKEAARFIRQADLVIVLDISDVGRLGHLGELVQTLSVPVACIDHHQTNGRLPNGPRLVDPSASATGELVYELARLMEWEIKLPVARALYVAILSDTGGFRYSNTTSRSLRIAGELLDCGLDAEEIYREVYASEPEGKVRLLVEVLDTLVVESDLGLAWVTVPKGALKRQGLSPDDLEGVVEFPRSIAGVRLALLFRTLSNGRIKVSFRSLGDVDVSRLAAEFGGGGHRRAAGASLEGTLPEVQSLVLARAREALR